MTEGCSFKAELWRGLDEHGFDTRSQALLGAAGSAGLSPPPSPI